MTVWLHLSEGTISSYADWIIDRDGSPGGFRLAGPGLGSAGQVTHSVPLNERALREIRRLVDLELDDDGGLSEVQVLAGARVADWAWLANDCLCGTDVHPNPQKDPCDVCREFVRRILTAAAEAE